MQALRRRVTRILADTGGGGLIWMLAQLVAPPAIA